MRSMRQTCQSSVRISISLLIQIIICEVVKLFDCVNILKESWSILVLTESFIPFVICRCPKCMELKLTREGAAFWFVFFSCCD